MTLFNVVDVHQSTVCSVELTERQVKNLRGAIKNNFVFEMFIGKQAFCF